MNKRPDLLKKVYLRPFTYVTDSVAFETSKMLILLLVQVCLLLVSRSFSAVFVVLAAVLGSVAADLFSKKCFGSFNLNHFSILVSIVQGIITGMLIPENYSPVTVFVTTLLVMLIVKHFFGGFSYAWANPAAFTVVVLWIIGVACFPKYQITMDLISMRNPSQILIENGTFGILPFDSGITDALNSTIFSLFKVSIPEGYVSLLWDTHSLIPAFRFNFITLISSIIIFSDNLYKLITPAFFVSIYVLLVRFVSPFFCNGVLYQGDMLLCILTGGTLFCATFVLPWFGTTPMSVSGKIIYGICAGCVAFLIAGPGTSPSGMIFTVIVSNIVSIIIQQWEARRDRINLKKKLEAFNNLEKRELEGL